MLALHAHKRVQEDYQHDNLRAHELPDELLCNQGASPGTSVLCYLNSQGHRRDAKGIVKSLFTSKKAMRCGQCEGPGALVPPQPGSVTSQPSWDKPCQSLSQLKQPHGSCQMGL